jgi:hypothetical protein
MRTSVMTTPLNAQQSNLGPKLLETASEIARKAAVTAVREQLLASLQRILPCMTPARMAFDVEGPY